MKNPGYEVIAKTEQYTVLHNPKLKCKVYVVAVGYNEHDNTWTRGFYFNSHVQALNWINMRESQSRFEACYRSPEMRRMRSTLRLRQSQS